MFAPGWQCCRDSLAMTLFELCTHVLCVCVWEFSPTPFFGKSCMTLLMAFSNNPQLQQFTLSDVTPTGKKIGIGSYGSVEEVYNHLLLD